VFEKSNDYTDKSNGTTWKEGNSATDLWFERLKNRISDSSEYHNNNHLTDTQIQKDLVFILDMYWNLVLHEQK
jgi:hypothetical protein